MVIYRWTSAGHKPPSHRNQIIPYLNFSFYSIRNASFHRLAKYTTTTRKSVDDDKKGIASREYLLPVGPGLRVEAKRVSELVDETQILAGSGCG